MLDKFEQKRVKASKEAAPNVKILCMHIVYINILEFGACPTPLSIRHHGAYVQQTPENKENISIVHTFISIKLNRKSFKSKRFSAASCHDTKLVIEPSDHFLCCLKP